MIGIAAGRSAAQPDGEQRCHHVRVPPALPGEASPLHLREVRVPHLLLHGW